MAKYKSTPSWKLSVVLGVMLLCFGIYISFQTTDKTFLQEAIKAATSIGCMLVGIMQFRLAHTIYKKSQDTSD